MSNSENAFANQEIKAAESKASEANTGAGGATDEKRTMTPQEIVDQVARGKLELSVPILSKDVEVAVLHYDFMALSGFEYADAMDSDSNGSFDSFHLTHHQALALFAAAVTKKTKGVDRTVIVRGLSICDSIKAVQLATLFFTASSRAANGRITRE